MDFPGNFRCKKKFQVFPGISRCAGHPVRCHHIIIDTMQKHDVLQINGIGKLQVGIFHDPPPPIVRLLKD